MIDLTNDTSITLVPLTFYFKYPILVQFDYLHFVLTIPLLLRSGKLLSHHLLDPRHKFLNVGVHPGQMFPPAADAPRNQPDQRLPPVQRQRQRSAGIALTAVAATLLVAGAQKHVVDGFAPTCGPEPPLAAIVRYHLDVHFLEICQNV